MGEEIKFKRILLKLSGESLAGPEGYGIDPLRAEDVAQRVQEIIDLGVENVEEGEDGPEVLVQPDRLEETAVQLSKMGLTVTGKELIREPVSRIRVGQENRPKVIKFLSQLEEHDDVQKVFANPDFSA